MKLVNTATRMRVPVRRCSARPIEDASMAQVRTPASANCRNARCSRTGSGVVMPVVSRWGAIPMPKVPTRAHGACACSSLFNSTPAPPASACTDKAPASHQALLVLPLVPVKATTSSAWVGLPNHCAAMSAVADFRPGSAARCSPARPKGSTPSRSTRQATAPRARASGTWARPSVAAPGQAMKPSPGCIWRLSVCNVPVTRARSHCTASALWASVCITAIPPRDLPRFAA